MLSDYSYWQINGNKFVNFHFISNVIINRSMNRSCFWIARVGHVLRWSVALLILVAGAGSGMVSATPVSSKAGLGAHGHGLAPLGARDQRLYREIMALQDEGRWDAADVLIGRLRDPLLLGHVQRQRYMHPDAYRSTYEELHAWLEHYGDHPDADPVYRLALARRPAGAPEPLRPVAGYLGGSGQERQEVTGIAWRSARERSADEDAAVRAWRDEIDKLAGSRQPAAAAALLDLPAMRRLADEVETDLARWAVAGAWLAVGEDLEALKLARRAAARSGDIVPEIHWTAGFSAWRIGRSDLAARHFTALAQAEAAHPSERSRAAFWAARAHIVEQKPQHVGGFLQIAAEDPQGIYGVLARAVLGKEEGYDWDDLEAHDEGIAAVAELPGGRRALALGQIGQSGLAEQEIRKLAARVSPALMPGLIGLAAWLDLPAAQMRLAQSLRHHDGGGHHAALYPLPSWQPTTGFTVDRALVYAVMRAESGFDPEAESYAGARGLMQVMPATAKEIALRSELELADWDGLFEPATGMTLGQAYLDQILRLPRIGDNLMFVAVAYNAGPGRVASWCEGLGPDPDPLLFLESIPLRETRIYVKKVLTNFWTYRARFGQPRPSLEALAGNAWPLYRALDTKPTLHAWN
jgi:soluble lytic murein transglycosylase-like protein